MTARDLRALIDRNATLPVEGGAIVLDVVVVDARTRFGTTDVMVQHVSSAGVFVKWTPLDRVTLV